jgi:indolepyruvate decarboxylase
MLGKSVVSERHPLFIGLYEGAIGNEEVTRFVEDSDLVLMLGAFLSDINLGIYTAKLDPDRWVYATSEELRISHHHYHHVGLKEYIEGLTAASLKTATREIPAALRVSLEQEPAEESDGQQPLRTSRMMATLNRHLDSDSIVVADVGDSLFAATELTIHDRGEFLSPAYYTSMGFSIPAALGAATARPKHRVVVLVGDGAFQMTGQELSTLIANGHAPVIILLDNHGYGTERYLHAGDWKYNEINPWNYCELLKVYGGGVGHHVSTEGEFENALEVAWKDPSQTHMIQAKLLENDASQTLKKLAARMGEHVG